MRGNWEHGIQIPVRSHRQNAIAGDAAANSFTASDFRWDMALNERQSTVDPEMEICMAAFHFIDTFCNFGHPLRSRRLFLPLFFTYRRFVAQESQVRKPCPGNLSDDVFEIVQDGIVEHEIGAHDYSMGPGLLTQFLPFSPIVILILSLLEAYLQTFYLAGQTTQ